MQLHLTIDEFELLKQLVEDENRLSRSEMPSLQFSVQPSLQNHLHLGRDVLEKALSRNLQLGFDELEDLADLLNLRKKQLMREISCLPEPTERSGLELQLSVLEHFLEKVTEACAMV